MWVVVLLWQCEGLQYFLLRFFKSAPPSRSISFALPHPLISHSPIIRCLSCSAVIFFFFFLGVKRSTVIFGSGLFVRRLSSDVC